MTEDALNRIGIILNFFAGFLLAPELIGLHRIERVEQWAEGTSNRLKEHTTERLEWMKTHSLLAYRFDITAVISLRKTLLRILLLVLLVLCQSEFSE